MGSNPTLSEPYLPLPFGERVKGEGEVVSERVGSEDGGEEGKSEGES